MSRERLATGHAGEDAAAAFLSRKGMRIIQRNYRCRLGELDIVARDGPCLVFVEVRTVTGNTEKIALESIGRKKKDKLRKLALQYILSQKAGDSPLRFDVVAVTVGLDNKLHGINHIINAF